MSIQEKTALTREAYPPRSESGSERDRLLVEAHLHRDADAFTIIVDDHLEFLIAQARRMLGPNGAVEDAVQETFERALRYLHRFGRSGDYRLGAWLSQILRNVVQDQRARSFREERVAFRASVAEIGNEADVADQVGDPVLAAALHEAVLRLPTSQRAAFVMREVVGLAYSDVAQVLNISEDNARARVSRSKGRLRRTTANLRSMAGALVSLPAGLRALQGKLAGRVPKLTQREKGHLLGVGDRMATQLSASPVGQTALTLVSSSNPRGTLVFGLAAAVATLSASTAALVGSGSATGAQASAATAQTILAADQAAPIAGPRVPSDVQTPAPTVPNTTPEIDGPSYSWVNVGVGPDGPPGAAVASLPVATCVPSNGVTPPGPGFSVGTTLGLADAVSVADTPAVDLTTVGPSFAFSATATITPYGSAMSTASATVVSNVCVSSTGGWFTAMVSGLGDEPIQLVGTLQTVIGSVDDAGYVFRGTLEPSASVAGPLAGAVQFVVDVNVLEPDNTAQLTVVFLGTEPQTGSPDLSAETGPAGGDVSTTPDEGGVPSNGSNPVTSSGAPTLSPVILGWTGVENPTGGDVSTTPDEGGVPSNGSNPVTSSGAPTLSPVVLGWTGVESTTAGAWSWAPAILP